MKYIANNTGIVFFFDGKPVKVDKGTNQYVRILAAFELPEADREASISKILFEKNGYSTVDGFVISPESVIYNGVELPAVLAQKVRSLVEEGLPVALFAKFWENIQNNPSSSSVRELYDFLAYKELPLTEDGCFLAYKGLDNNYWSISGNTKTLVVKGKVNSSGKIFNGVGEEIEVMRRDVDDNRNNHCSFGLHVGSLDYAQSFSRGKLVVVKVNPKDVVSVPSDYNCQKCRVSAYKVVSGFGVEIKAPAADENGVELESEAKKSASEFVARVDNYLTKKKQLGFNEVSLKAIQNAFSPDYPSRLRVKDAIESLGYTLWTDGNGSLVVAL
jgi:hypothetical protein